MRRGVFLGFLVGLLGACSGGGGVAPFAESRTPATLAERFYPPEGWAWGFLRIGDGPAQRYGVAAPVGVPRAEVLILPDYGETAETWFETVRDLTRRGLMVWVLEGAGQGGSGRLSAPRDLGYAASFGPDIAGVRAMGATVIRAAPGLPLIIVGQGVGGLIAARAAQAGMGVQGLVLSSAAITLRRHPPAVRFLGLDRLRSPGAGGWRPDAPDAFALGATHDRWRGAVTMTWQRANPDLRMGGPSLGWLDALDAAVRTVRQDGGNLGAPVLVVEGDRARGCRRLARCSAIRLAGGGEELELERDPVRGAWLDAIDAFIGARRVE